MANQFNRSPRQQRASLGPAIFRRNLESDTPAILQTWQRYLENPTDADRRTLFDFYAPLAWIAAAKCKRRDPLFFREPIEDLAADASIALWEALPKAQFACAFGKYALLAMRKGISREVLKRSGIVRRERWNILVSIRARFVRDEGRMPDSRELNERLMMVLDNPAFAPAFAPSAARPRIRCIHDCQSPKAATIAIRNALSREPSPDARMLEDETIRLALKEFHGTDRKILKRILRGDAPRKIALDVNLPVSAVRYRLNGLLWEARARADLAAHLGTAPVPVPCRTRASRVPGRGAGNLPPQAMALRIKSLPAEALGRAERTDAEIIALLRGGYSQRQLIAATAGKTKKIRARISQLQRALLADMEVPPARRVAG
jgi:hypothetical protein